MNKIMGLRLRRFVPVGLIALAAAVLLAPAPASATAYVLKLVQKGSNVVATGSGEFDLGSLTNVNTATTLPESPGIFPSGSVAGVGSGVAGARFDTYTGTGTGPIYFGSGGYTRATGGTGDAVAIVIEAFDVPLLYVPTGYVSGTALSDTAVYDKASFASLGATPGTYVWRWGSAADQSFTLKIGNSISTTPIYSNLNSVSDGSDPVNAAGPLADSFSTGNSSFSLASVGLKLAAADPSDGGSITVDLLSDNSTSPGSVLYTIGTLDDSSLTTTLGNYFLDLATPFLLSANTRYWIQLSDPASSVDWSWSLDQTAQGVAGEYFANTNGVFPNSDGPYQMQLSDTPAAVAEPDSVWLLALGVLACVWLGRKRIAGRA